MGPGIPRPHRPRPRAAGVHAAGGLHAARRQRGCRGDHVAHHARRAGARRAQDPPELLPAHDHRHGSGLVRMKYVFDLELSARAPRLNRFLHSLTNEKMRSLFLANPEQTMQGLTEKQTDMVRRLDWQAMISYAT